MKVFIEEQRFTQWWLWILNLSVLAIPVYGIVQQIIYKIPFGNKPMTNTGLVIFLLAMIAFNYFFYLIKLKTRIDEKGIAYSFYPFNLKYKIIKWNEINSIYVRKYNPITEYGGWGIKRDAKNIKGNIGIQLQLKNGKKLLIGTQKKQEAQRVLLAYKNKINEN